MKKVLSLCILMLIIGCAIAQQEKKDGKSQTKKQPRGFILDEFNQDISYVFMVDSTFYDYLVCNNLPDFKWKMMDSLYHQGMITDDSAIEAMLGPSYDRRYQVIFKYAIVRPIDTSAILDSLNNFLK